jgi:molybdopterin-binding protein
MNKIPAIISSITTEGSLSLVTALAGGISFSAIVVDNPATAPNLLTGNGVNLLFKENELVIARNFTGMISMLNKIDCVVKSVENGKILSSIKLSFLNFEITSLITAKSALQMQLEAGDRVTAMIKTNEISLSYHD